MTTPKQPLPRGVAGFSWREIYDAVSRASSISGGANTDVVKRWMTSLYGRKDISTQSLAGTLRAMYDAGYLGMKKRKTAVNPSEHDIWSTIKPPPEA